MRNKVLVHGNTKESSLNLEKQRFNRKSGKTNLIDLQDSQKLDRSSRFAAPVVEIQKGLKLSWYKLAIVVYGTNDCKYNPAKISLGNADNSRYIQVIIVCCFQISIFAITICNACKVSQNKYVKK